MQRLNEDLMLLTDCATAQMFGCQPFVMETWVQPKASPRGINIGPIGIGAGFSPRAPLLFHTHSSITDAI